MPCDNYDYDYEFYVEDIEDYVTVKLNVEYTYDSYQYHGDFGSSGTMVDIGVDNITPYDKGEIQEQWVVEKTRMKADDEYNKFIRNLEEEIMENI